MKNKRILEIIRILLQEKDFITIYQVSQMLGVSNKTIRNDLVIASKWLEEHDMVLCKKTGIGICIEGNPQQKLQILNQILTHSKKEIGNTPKARKIYIGLRLINCVDKLRVYELSSELYVSRATIHKDLTSLNETFEKHNISIVRKSNHGVYVEGKEYHLRSLMFSLMTSDPAYIELSEMVRKRVCKNPNNFLFTALDYTENDFFNILQIMLDKELKYIYNLQFTALIELFLHVCIVCFRVADGKDILLSESFLSELSQKPYYDEAYKLSKALEAGLQINLSEQEIRYIQVYLLALKSNSYDIEQNEAHNLTLNIISVWENLFNLPFSHDEELKSSLEAHLYPAITRSKHGIHIENPMMNEIQMFYKNTFLAVRESLNKIKDLSYTFNDDEVGYLTIHLAAALERMKQPLKTILICHLGVGTGNLILRKLSKHIPEIEITAQETFISIENKNLSEFDLVISTLPIDNDIKIPVIVINPLPREHDIKQIKSAINKYYNHKNDPLNNINIDKNKC